MTRTERDELEQLQVMAARLGHQLAELDRECELAAVEAAEAASARLEAQRISEAADVHNEPLRLFLRDAVMRRVGACVSVVWLLFKLFGGACGRPQSGSAASGEAVRSCASVTAPGGYGAAVNSVRTQRR